MQKRIDLARACGGFNASQPVVPSETSDLAEHKRLGSSPLESRANRAGCQLEVGASYGDSGAECFDRAVDMV